MLRARIRIGASASAFDVTHLSRPAKIRCRPQLFQRDLSFGQQRYDSTKPVFYSTELRKKPAPASNEKRVQRVELEDYELALAEAQSNSGSSKAIKRTKPAPRKSRLPSLSRLESFHLDVDPRSRLPRPADIPSSPTAEASSSKLSPSIQNPSVKGKERAVEDFQDPLPVAVVSVAEKIENVKVESTAETKLRRNAVGVQLLSPTLHSQLFPGPSLPKPPESLLKISTRHLKDNKLSPEGAAILPEINFDLPSLAGTNIKEHFHTLGQEIAQPYFHLAREFGHAELPVIPGKWEIRRAGWTKYHPDGRREAVKDLGDEKMVSFDVETLYKLSPFPVMATAASATAWYSWLSPTIFQDPPDQFPPASVPWDTRTPSHHPHDLIPLFKGSEARVVIGHNVGYDRARVADEYSLERTATRWLDTLSLHVATRGMTTVQRPAWMAHRKNKKAKLEREAESLTVLQEMAEESGDADMIESLKAWGEGEAEAAEAMENRWQDVTSVNSLAEVASLHCGIAVDKSIRNRFADESIKHASQLRPELEQLLTYCANDVKITHEVYKKVLLLFFESCPHPATFAGVLSMGNSFLPVDESWEEYLRNAELTYREMDQGVKKALRILAEKLRKEGLKEGDPWADQLDWTPKNARWAEDFDKAQDIPPPTTAPKKEATKSFTAATAVSESSVPTKPLWIHNLEGDKTAITSLANQRRLLPLILKLTYRGNPVAYLSEHYWCFMVPHDKLCDYIDFHGAPVSPSDKDKHLDNLEEKYAFFRIAGEKGSRKTKLVGPVMKSDINKGLLTSPYDNLLNKAVANSELELLADDLWSCVEEMEKMGKDTPWGQQLNWSPAQLGLSAQKTAEAQADSSPQPSISTSVPTKKVAGKADAGQWPKWYWDLTGPASRIPAGELDLTFKKTIAPLLLRLQWQGYPLIHSRTHKWLYRVPRSTLEQGTTASAALKSRGDPVIFDKDGPDEIYALDKQYLYFRLPHKDGEGKNVGNPLSKHFVKSIESGELASAAVESGDDVAARAATDATNMNAFCSYWISSRERIMDQMVIYRDQSRSQGMILPQVITMGTVTRRAVEATWLTASNAKKNRVGSELKAMVRAPPGYSIVGADVDSEELWISSVMGDSQFGMHGATAIGWMTLEGTKSAGTDLHSKTANILGISRDAAKVFNYSRIYGAGKKHAVQLLMQGDSSLTKEMAYKLADNLYKETKGAKATRNKQLQPARVPSLWHGGSESYLFNTLEAIALSDRPTTPALGCGVTKALRKSYLDDGSSYLPSRVNWVVQSSGVDYLHLLIVSMEYLIKKYNIQARYLISVHDEVRYLSKEEDRYRLALALQIANCWTRALFCYNLGMDDMPQGIAFFSAVDVDFILRKEVDMSCETPSHKRKIPPGESLGILELLKKTNNGDLGQPIISSTSTTDNEKDTSIPIKEITTLFGDIQSNIHEHFLQAQAGKSPMAAKNYLDNLPSILPLDADAGAGQGGEGQMMVVPKLRMKMKSTVPKRVTAKRAT